MQFLIISTFLLFSINFLQAASSSDDSRTDSFVQNQIQPDCLECPDPARSNKTCEKDKLLYLTERTCYTCPTYKCVKRKYFREDGAKICPKLIPNCNGQCKKSQTCLITVQTRYSCPKAKCIAKLLNRRNLEDYAYVSKKK